MSLKHALLGFLNYQSMTGYTLKQCFDQSVQHFWNASLSQIYPTLNQMKEEGLLTMEIKYQDASPNAKIYQITAAGRSELQRWLAEPIEAQPSRSAFLVKIFFSANIDRQVVLAQLKERLEQAKANLVRYHQSQQEIINRRASANDSPQDCLFWSLTADYGIKHEEANIAWYKESIKTIEALSGAGRKENSQP